MSLISLPRLEAEGLVRVDDREHPDHAAVAARPAPRQGHERAALAGDLVEVAADVLDAGDAALTAESGDSRRQPLAAERPHERAGSSGRNIVVRLIIRQTL